MASSKAGGWGYLPALDGVRALSVLAVLVFHANPDWLPGGFLGVDAFFVLSGFLITGLLLTELRTTGRIALAAFWGRRARRLLPALLVVLVTVVVISRMLLTPSEVSALRWDAIAALMYVANWRMIFRGGDCFAATAPPSPLQHTWSLGIEEQFYVVWPLLVLLALLMPKPRTALLWVSGIGIVVSGVLCAWVYSPDADPGRAYYGTDTRAGALLLGCWLAALFNGRSRPHQPQPGRRPKLPQPSRLLSAAAAVAAAALVAMWATVHGTDTWLYRGGLTGLAAAVAVAVLLAYLVATPGGWGTRLLSLPPLPWIGRISYGLYLWHWPLLQWLTGERTGLTGIPLFVLRVVVSLAVTVACYYAIETPLRKLFTPRPAANRSRPAKTASWRSLAPVTSLVLAGVAALAVGITAEPTAAAEAAQASDDAPLVQAEAANDPSGAPAPAAAAGAPMTRPGRKPGANPRIAFFGDSVAWTVGSYLPPHPGLSVANRAIQGCGIARLPDIRYIGTAHTNYPGCDQWDAKWRATIPGDDPDVSVILLNRWELMDRRLGGSYQHVGDPAFNAYLTKELNTAIDIAGSNGARVVLLRAAYTHRAERPDGGLWPEDTPERVNAWNTLLATVAAGHPKHPKILDLNKVVCPGGAFTWTVNGIKVRSDGLHFTPEGVKQVIAPWLLPQLKTLATSA
ncbi:acyltransferase family protein [Dactylosporangium sp. CA-139066]|uniref:acyltransferase family protein n=1 Tax=Dactylosporangium sp. CA-139066 TaxID=3239930 RepID=UPI003D904DAA